MLLRGRIKTDLDELISKDLQEDINEKIID